MFTLIVFGVTCSFVDPLQSTVLTPLTSSFKCRNNIGTHRSHLTFQDFSYATMVLVATRVTRHAMLPHMCGNEFSQMKQQH
jgi:hypothetical protein